MPAADLTGAAAQARKAETEKAPVEPDAPDVIEADKAFLVYVLPTGQIVMTHDLNVPLVVKRAPTHDEVYGTLEVILKDLRAQQTAMLSAQAIIQMQQQMVQQMQNNPGVNPELEKILRQVAREKHG
jgi:hypothetical protein